MPDIRLRPSTTVPSDIALDRPVDSRADIILRPIPGSDIALAPTDRPASAAAEEAPSGSTLSGAVTQAAAVPSGTLLERFVLTSAAVTQAAAAPSGTLTERFIASGAVTQAAATPSGTLVERFIVAGEPTQAASSLSGDLITGAASGNTIAGAITQAAGVVAGTLQRSGSVQQPSGASKPLFFRDPRYLTPPSPATIAGAVTQQTATIAGSFTTHENEDWLLGLFATEEQLIFA
jgi:hypothetical protein